MSTYGADALRFNLGIAEVLHNDDDLTLPSNAPLTPSDLSSVSELSNLLAARDYREFLDQALRPHVEDRRVLDPGYFRDLLAETIILLKDGQTRYPEHARALRRAVGVLSDETALRDLLGMYRGMLHKG